MTKKYWDSDSFPKSNFYQIIAKTGDLDWNVFHSKVAIINEGDEITDDTGIYIGSHNLSPSAWGNVNKECT